MKANWGMFLRVCVAAVGPLRVTVALSWAMGGFFYGVMTAFTASELLPDRFVPDVIATSLIPWIGLAILFAFTWSVVGWEIGRWFDLHPKPERLRYARRYVVLFLAGYLSPPIIAGVVWALQRALDGGQHDWVADILLVLSSLASLLAAMWCLRRMARRTALAVSRGGSKGGTESG